MSINFANGVSVSIGEAGTTIALQSGATGIYAPLNPAFAATGANAATVNTVVTWTTKEFDVLNNFSTSTHRFTASIAGNYFFKYHQLLNYETAGEYRVNFRKNTVGQWGRSIYYKANSSAYTTIQVEAKIPLAVNDYVDVYIETAPAGFGADAGWNYFQGYMI